MLHHSLEKWNRFKMEIEQLKELMSEKDVAMKAMCTRVVDMKKEVITVDTEEGLLSKTSGELLSPVSHERVKGVRTGTGFISSIPLLYLRFVFHVEGVIVPYCCRGVSVLFSFSIELQRSWRSRYENVHE